MEIDFLPADKRAAGDKPAVPVDQSRHMIPKPFLISGQHEFTGLDFQRPCTEMLPTIFPAYCH
ncbi:MAG: hypothetical protein CMN28_14305 [Salinisphaeraceae bacterium]|nr:hypothetical protein [Salinisphaeraceae bacterium]